MINSIRTRRSLLAGLAVAPGFLIAVDKSRRLDPKQAHSSPGPIIVVDGPKDVILSNGIVSVACNKQSGLAAYSWGGAEKIKNVYSSVDLSGRLTTAEYARRTCDAHPLSVADGIGKGLRFTIVHSSEGQPDLLQHYTLYEGKPFFLVQAEIRSPESVSTNYIGALVVDSPGAVDIGIAGENRVLRVPFDNDMWFRYQSLGINSSDVSCEVTAVFDNVSRNGLVFGSVNHETWKSGVRFSGSNGRLDKLEVFAGLTTPGVNTFTHDSLPHGKVSGRSVSSPAMFVGFYSDWRDGLEEYGRANSAFKAPLPWSEGIPFGWNSWAAYTGHINYSGFLGAAEFIANKLASSGFNRDRVLYFNLDSFWSHLDAAALRDAVEYIRNLGRDSGIECRPGIYFTPFAVWSDDFTGFVEGTGLRYRYRDILLRKPDGSVMPRIAQGTPLDPTHPGTTARNKLYIRTFVDLGFQFLKLDFLSHGSLEAAHWDKSVQTGIEAYNQGMKVVVDEAAGKMFLSLSIAPLFPSGYGHARRISCDTMGHISGRNESTEYMLNSLTYGWWTNRSIYIADPDEIPLGPLTTQGARDEHEGRSRLLSAIISGGMILDSSAFLEDQQARSLAEKIYTNPRVNGLAGGAAFRPVEGNTGDGAGDLFVREDRGGYYLAVFNFDGNAAASKQIRLERISKRLAGPHGVAVTDVWADKPLGNATGSLAVPLAPAESKLLMLVP